MPDIVVNYLHKKIDDDGADVFCQLGCERFSGVVETLIPGYSDSFKVFLVKKFSSSEAYRWFVSGVECREEGGEKIFDVFLENIFSELPFEYLSQTVKKTGSSVAKIVRQGTLVEVDYGFIQNVAKVDGSIKTNKRYSDTIQHGEMHKRRLAIVVKSTGTTLQVVPVTSKVPAASNKSCFKIADETIAKLRRYSSSGKQSWAICDMIETVSIRRVLPPVSFYEKRGARAYGRNVRYPVALSVDDMKELKGSLLHSIGVSDYLEFKDKAAGAKVLKGELSVALSDVAALNERCLGLELRLTQLGFYKSLAEEWAQGMGVNLEELIQQRSTVAAASIPTAVDSAA